MNTPNDNGESAAAFYDKRRRWMDLVCEHRQVHHVSFRVGYWLARKMNGKDQCCWWSVDQIAKQIGVSRRAVIAATTELERLNLLIIVRQKGRGNTYYLHLPFE